MKILVLDAVVIQISNRSKIHLYWTLVQLDEGGRRWWWWVWNLWSVDVFGENRQIAAHKNKGTKG